MKFKDLKIGDKFFINDNPKDQFEKINDNFSWNTKWVNKYNGSTCNIPTDHEVVQLNIRVKFSELPEGSFFKIMSGIELCDGESPIFMKAMKNPFGNYMIEHDAVWITKKPGFTCYFHPETRVEKQNGNS